MNVQRSDQGPLAGFADCHAGILSRFERLRRLPQLLADPAAPKAASQFANEIVRFVREAVFEHHAEEEEALFPAVLRSAAPGDERIQVKCLIDRLTTEHRELESQWSELEPPLRKLARGRRVELDGAAIERFCLDYEAHARFEESDWLPLSARILEPNHQAALGLTLHLRHALEKVIAHI